MAHPRITMYGRYPPRGQHIYCFFHVGDSITNQDRRKRYGWYGHGLTKVSYILVKINHMLFKKQLTLLFQLNSCTKCRVVPMSVQIEIKLNWLPMTPFLVYMHGTRLTFEKPFVRKQYNVRLLSLYGPWPYGSGPMAPYSCFKKFWKLTRDHIFRFFS